MKEKVKEWKKCWFEGEVTLPKTTVWLVGAVCLLLGVVHGLRTAPLTHGMTIASNNGNNCGSNNGNAQGKNGEEENQEEENQEEENQEEENQEEENQEEEKEAEEE